MALYGMKDAANLAVFSKETGLPAMFIDYANASSSEWTSESVYATAKGTNAIRWDNARTGTLTLETEIFDLSLLAMAMGSDVKNGETPWFKRVVGEIDATKAVEIGTENEIDPKSISVVKLKEDLIEHDGLPIQQGGGGSLPEQVMNLVVSANDTSAKITFDKVTGAEGYVVKRDGVTVATADTNNYTDSELTAETAYKYTVAAKNAFGEGPASAEVTATTAAAGTTEFANFEPTPEQEEAAKDNAGTPSNTTGGVTWSFSGNTITFGGDVQEGDFYAIYFLEVVKEARTLTIAADKYPGSYEIYADAMIREKETGRDDLCQIHYPNAKPQSNFTLTQSATEPTSLSIVFDLFPDKNNILAEMKVIQ